MSLVVKSKPSIPALESGVYMGYLVWAIDMGEQRSEVYKKYQDRLLLGFEICGESIERGNGAEPRMLSKGYTATFGKKSNLRKDLQDLRGRDLTDSELDSGLNIADLLGTPLQLNVTVSDEGRNNVSTLMRLPKGVKIDKRRMDLKRFDIEQSAEELEALELPQWIADQISKSTQWQKRSANGERISMDDAEPDAQKNDVGEEPGF